MNKKLFQKMDKQEYDYCPCSGHCCDKPELFCPEHVCEAEDFCEECYVSECANCHKSCACDL